MIGSLRDVIGNCEWVALTTGSGATLHRLVGLEGQETRYLKMMNRFSGTALAFEAERTRWAAERLPAPEVLAFREEGIMEYLLLAEVPGVPANDPQLTGREAELVPLLAAGLREIHKLPWQECPYDMRTGWLVQMAKMNLHSGRSAASSEAEQALQELAATRPETREEDLVVVHGDYRCANILLDADRMQITGYLDWGNLGMGDRYLDLATAVNSIEGHFGAHWVPAFLQAYGFDDSNVANALGASEASNGLDGRLGQVDEWKLRWYRALDSFL
jgi:aminoglycoside phosphotransferase